LAQRNVRRSNVASCVQKSSDHYPAFLTDFRGETAKNAVSVEQIVKMPPKPKEMEIAIYEYL